MTSCLPLTDAILARKQQSTKFETKESAASASIVSSRFNLVRPFLDHAVQLLPGGVCLEGYLLAIVNGRFCLSNHVQRNNIRRTNHNDYHTGITAS